MANYTKVNFNDLEASSSNESVKATFARKHLNSKELGVSLFKYSPNYKSPHAHSHKVQEEVYVIVKGSGRLLLDDEVIEISLHDVIRVAPEVVRAFSSGEDGLEVLAVGGHKPQDGDGVRAEAIWADNHDT